MNRSVVVYTLGKILQIEAVLLLIPFITGLIYHEPEAYAYLYTAFISLILGVLLGTKKPKSHVFYLREGCLITVISWIFLTVISAIPFIITGEMNGSVIDSLYESISGLTTTGSSILSSVEAVSNCTNLWRCLLHWIGGLGVLVFLLAVIPLSGGSNMNIMRAESSSGKLVPKIRSTAMILYAIYTILTVIQVLLLMIGDTSFFDSICIAFSTAGTGGFGIKDGSISGYSPYVQWVTTTFMFLFSLKIAFYYYLVVKGIKKAFSFDEIRAFIFFVIGCVVVICIDLSRSFGYSPDTIRETAFTVASIVSTTGFYVADFNVWPIFSQAVIMGMMIIGGCSGSTAGGFKMSRVVILLKSFRREVSTYLHPRNVKTLKMDGAPLKEEVIHSTTAFFVVYVIIFIGSILLVSIAENDLVTTFSSVSASLNNVGPGLGLAGPTGNMAYNTAFSKIILMIDMLAGRLELFPLIIFFHTKTWKDIFRRGPQSLPPTN